MKILATLLAITVMLCGSMAVAVDNNSSKGVTITATVEKFVELNFPSGTLLSFTVTGSAGYDMAGKPTEGLFFNTVANCDFVLSIDGSASGHGTFTDPDNAGTGYADYQDLVLLTGGSPADQMGASLFIDQLGFGNNYDWRWNSNPVSGGPRLAGQLITAPISPGNGTIQFRLGGHADPKFTPTGGSYAPAGTYSTTITLTATCQ